MQNVDIALLRDNAGFSLTMQKWNTSRKIPQAKAQAEITVNAKAERVKHSKTLLEDCAEYDAITKHLSETYQWCMNRSMPSFFKDGFYLVKLDQVSRFEEYLAQALEKLSKELVPAFLAVYPAQREQAEKDLNGLFSSEDFPPVDKLASKFGIRWNWISFGVPDNLPSELRAKEAEKIQASFAVAQEKILDALREGFQGLIDHAVKMLTVEPGQKPKKLYESTLENVQAFIQTFSARNLMNDQALENLVKQAEAILTDSPTTEKLRDDQALRNRIAEKFSEVKKAVDGMITERASRKFNLDE